MTAQALCRGISIFLQLRCAFDQANKSSFLRQGTPTPVQPDFDNLKSAWAQITPSGVASSAYAATVKTSAPSCPAATATGWNVDPLAALPTLGAANVSPGMPSSVVQGSITVTGTIPMSTSSSTSLTYRSTAASSSTTESASAATSSGAAGKATPGFVSSGELSLTGMIVALIAVGAGVVIWL
jgi:1,3-beta-glucanosyltransferase GAS1